MQREDLTPLIKKEISLPIFAHRSAFYSQKIDTDIKGKPSWSLVSDAFYLKVKKGFIYKLNLYWLLILKADKGLWLYLKTQKKGIF